MKYTGITPMNDYNSRGLNHALEILKKHGFIITANSKDKIYIMHPEGDIKKHKLSGNISKKYNTLYMYFSPNMITPEKPYKLATIFAELECLGNLKEATKKLRELGYGAKQSNNSAN